MLRNQALIYAPQLISGSVYRIQLYFKDSAKAKYLNINDVIEDTVGNTYEVLTANLPLQDGEIIEISALGANVLPVLDVDYDSYVFTPDQKDYNPLFQTKGMIHYSSIHDPVNYEYVLKATWDGSFEENKADIGDRIVDANGKEYEITYIDLIQRFNVFFRVKEVHQTGSLPAADIATLFRATPNYGFYQGTGLIEEPHSQILARDSAVIDDILKQISDIAAQNTQIGSTHLNWRGDWDAVSIYSRYDVVQHNGGVFIYINPVSTSNIAPPDGTYWDLMITSSGGDAHFVFTQGVANITWNITHSLGKFPSVSVVDSGGSEVVGDIAHVDTNTCILTFSSPFTGKAYLN